MIEFLNRRRNYIIMRPEKFTIDPLIQFLQRQDTATLDEMKKVIGDPAPVTLFRKLRRIDYLSSYSHRGKYYALKERAQFDRRGLWVCRDAHFSRYGTLLDTIEAWVDQAERGCFAQELAAALEVEVKGTLLKLVRQERVTREEVSGKYLYCSVNPGRRCAQVMARTLPMRKESVFSPFPKPAVKDEELACATAFFVSGLNERQRRLFAGLESLRTGRGGDEAVARAMGMDPHTVAKGRRELQAYDLEFQGVRRKGGGRKPVEKKSPKSSPPFDR
jgi:hypothetical protein